MALSVPIILIIVGIIVALTVSWLLGVLLIIVGVVLLLVPYGRR